MNMLFEFYSAEGCHLCEKAQDILLQISPDMENIIRYIDITSNKELVKKYGSRIPVVRKMSDGSELGWPFDLFDAEKFTNQGKQTL